MIRKIVSRLLIALAIGVLGYTLLWLVYLACILYSIGAP